MQPKLYKVLKDGRSCHGGDLAYSLPTRAADGSWVPGEWHRYEGDLRVCAAGFHLTPAPAEWWLDGAECYEAEYDDEGAITSGDKVCVRAVRLTARLDEAKLTEFGGFGRGEHRVEQGRAWAYDSATVEAYNSATVRAYGSATVRAYGSATVIKFSYGVTVQLSDNAILIDRGTTPPTVCGVFQIQQPEQP